ncbi:MAG: hypothetical protein MUC34_17000 [Anaerolineae bacterium]|nr:hypothetical protein [Anaerolineae bacterium]
MKRMITLSPVPPRRAAEEAGNGAERSADQDRESDRGETDNQRHPRAIQHPAEEVAHVAVGAHDVLRLIRGTTEDVDARSLALFHLLLADQHLIGRIRRDNGRKDRNKGQKHQDN